MGMGINYIVQAQPQLGFLPKSISRLGSLELGKGSWEGFDGVPFVRVIKDFLLNKEVTSRALSLNNEQGAFLLGQKAFFTSSRGSSIGWDYVS
jgi:hypothetical protein